MFSLFVKEGQTGLYCFIPECTLIQLHILVLRLLCSCYSVDLVPSILFHFIYNLYLQ